MNQLLPIRPALEGATQDGATDRLGAAEAARLHAIATLQNALVLTDPNLPDNPIVYANPAFLELSGYPEEEVVGLNCRFLTGPGTDRAQVARLREAIQERRRVQVTLLNYRKDGTTFWNELTVAPVRDERGDLTHFVAVQTDVSALKEAEIALGESERRLRLALESGRLGIWDIDLTTGEYLDISATCKAHYGLPPEALFSGDAFFRAVHPDDRDRVRAAYEAAFQGHRDYGSEYRVVWPDGGVHWIRDYSSLIFGEDGRVVRMVGATQDITEAKRAEAHREEELREALERADRDALTDLWNHRAFQRRLEAEEARAQREGTSLAVVLVDLDNFKLFNDCYGHVMGDTVLRQVADRLRAVCRPYDTVARFGGDEFALLLPGVGRDGAAEIEARLHAELGGMSFHPEGQAAAIPITVSVGAAPLTPLTADRQEALCQADVRLRRSKSGGGVETEADGVRRSATSVEGFSMLDALVTAVDNKDRYTRRHSEDVMAYSLSIARGLGLDGAEQYTVAVAALLHDVGKIGVPDAILRKPGALTEAEEAAVRRHPAMGAAIVCAVPGLEDTLDAVRHHHERWDGGGYPGGLKGEETPLVARLMAVADGFSAMTTDRPYRNGMGHEKALSLLEAGAGTQWDPRCVEVFLEARRAVPMSEIVAV